MIVRNEEEFLAECLKSVKGVVDELVVVDTGSTDRTVPIARQFGARCYELPWSHDFAQMRNASLEYASKDFILVLDADEVLTANARAVIRQYLDEFSDADAFFVHILNQTDGDDLNEIEESLNVRLFRNNPQYRYSGALHEQIAESILQANPPGVIMDSPIELLHLGYMKNVVANKGKKERNLEIALREAEKHPGDGFRAFNLGLEYVRLEQFANALNAFQNAIKWSTPDALWVSRFYKIYITTLMQTGSWEEADKLIDDALVIFPDYTDLHYLKGVELFHRQNFVAALRHFARCIELGDPPIPPYTVEKGISTYRSYFAMGQAYQSLEKIAEAVVCYRQAFEQNPSFIRSFLHFSNLLLRDDAGSATLDYLSKVAKLAGGEHDALLGMALIQSDQFEQARGFLEKAEKTASVVEHLIILYACLNDQANLQQVLTTYDQTGEIQKHAYNYLLERGLKILEQGLIRFPDSPTLLHLKSEYEKGRA